MIVIIIATNRVFQYVRTLLYLLPAVPWPWSGPKDSKCQGDGWGQSLRHKQCYTVGQRHKMAIAPSHGFWLGVIIEHWHKNKTGQKMNSCSFFPLNGTCTLSLPCTFQGMKRVRLFPLLPTVMLGIWLVKHPALPHGLERVYSPVLNTKSWHAYTWLPHSQWLKWAAGEGREHEYEQLITREVCFHFTGFLRHQFEWLVKPVFMFYWNHSANVAPWILKGTLKCGPCNHAMKSS